MFEIIQETRIEAPIELVFDLVRDVDVHPLTATWTGETVVASSSKRLVLHDTVTFRARHFGLWQTLSVRVTAYDPPHLLVDEQTKGTFESLRHQHRFTQDGAFTVMKDTLQIEAPFGLLGRLAEQLFLKSYMTRFLKRRNAVLQQLAEERH